MKGQVEFARLSISFSALIVIKADCSQMLLQPKAKSLECNVSFWAGAQ